jgi:UDP-N-acetylglucosamine 2-epimerase
MRDTTERPEAVEAGAALLVGTDPWRIMEECERLLNDQAAYARMASVDNPFGDGHAGGRIANAVAYWLGGDPLRSASARFVQPSSAASPSLVTHHIQRRCGRALWRR